MVLNVVGGVSFTALGLDDIP